MKDIINDSRLAFHIAEDRTNAFEITERGGIIFVSNISALQTFPETLNNVVVKWPNSTASIIIQLEDLHAPNVTVKCTYIHDELYPISCAERTSKKDCLKSCGLATNGGA